MKLLFSERDCLEWSVAECIGLEPFLSRISKGQPLQIKLGIDPTSADVHLGRTIPLWRLRAFQELGHQIHLIIGSFTAQIGDTSDKESERPMLTPDQVKANTEGYLEQIWKILDPSKKDQVKIHYNGDWLSSLTLGEISHLADLFSVNSFIKRELVAKRLATGSRVSLREMLYPLMQGYDSLAVGANIELGGTDQRFNLLAGRTLQEQRGLVPQAIILNDLIPGSDGRKMSSSWGNVISLRDLPEEMFGKIMSINDTLIGPYLSFLPFSAQPFSIGVLHDRLTENENPRTLKLELAEALVELYYPGQGVTERQRFINRFTEQQPSSVIVLESGVYPLLEIITTKTSYSESKSELRRTFAAGGVELNGKKISDPAFQLKTEDLPALLKVGKKVLVQLQSA